MILVLACLRLISASPDDSAVLAEARRNLIEGDTLAAIDLLQDWSSTRAPSRAIHELLGVLQMPDEPIDTAVGNQASEAVEPKRRMWRLNLEGAALVSGRPAWEIGSTLLTQAIETKTLGTPTFFDIGFASVLWSGADDGSEWGVDPLIGISILSKNWGARVDSWTGWLGSRWDAGAIGTAYRNFGDSARSRGRLGAMVKWSRYAASMVGGFCQWDREWQPWSIETRTDLRLRRDPVEDSTLVVNGVPEDDSLRTTVRGARLQGLGRVRILRRFGRLSVGPAFEIDARTSLASDSWHDGKVRHRSIRRDGGSSVQGVARIALARLGFGEVRVGWLKGFSNSEIDPEFVQRNSGLLVAIGSALSF